MTTNLHKESATIYQFPVGGRAGLADRRAPVGQTPPRVYETVCSGSWYHEEAIREAEASRKN